MAETTLNVNVVEVKTAMEKLSLKPGEVLLIKTASLEIDEAALRALSTSFKQLFPDNKVAYMNLNTMDDIQFVVLGPDTKAVVMPFEPRKEPVDGE